jgi:hypothetical protein
LSGGWALGLTFTTTPQFRGATAAVRNGSGEASMTRTMLNSATLRLAAVAMCWGIASASYGQFLGGFQRSVGGVAVDAQGVLEAPTVDDNQELNRLRDEIQVDAPESLRGFTERRAVSLKQLEATIARCQADNNPIPAEVRCLGGLQRIQYVFVYPERQDIVLVGPAEGWKIDQLGNVVGVTTNRPVLMLDDLMVALRSGGPSRMEPITCSIDPTPEGLARLQQVMSGMERMGNPDETLSMIEEALGPQVISVTGVPASSHFARGMVAADFRMKRLAMNFEPAPVNNMPSFLSMVSGNGRGMDNMLPRWWLAPNYEPLAKTTDGLGWELRGPGVKCMTEEDYVNATGEKQRTGKASGIAVKWANSMTENFSELADHDSSFGQLRNLMDLAVIGALIEKEQLAEMGQFQAPWLMGQLELERYPAPTRTSSKASVVRKRGAWVISASGGVELAPWAIADRTETVAEVGQARESLGQPGADFWWQ